MVVRWRLSVGGLLCVLVFLALPVGVVEGARQAKLTLALRLTGGGGSATAGEEYVRAVLQDFSEQHPGIEVEYMPLTGSWQDKLTVEMVAGTAPDVFEMWGQFANDWADKGMLMDLDPFVKRDFSEREIKDFYPGQWQATLHPGGPHAGERIGLPRYVNTGILYYNLDAFDRAGLAYPVTLERQQNWNWNTFLEAARKLTERDAEGRVRMWGYREVYWAPWIYTAGGKAFDWPEDPYRYVMNEPSAVNALEFLRSLIWDYGVAQVSGNFGDGKAAMGSAWGSCSLGSVKAEAGSQFRWNTGPLPIGPTGLRHSWIGKDMWGMYSGTKHPQEAWMLVKFLVSPKGSALAARIIGEQPVRISALPAYRDAHPGVDVHYAVEMGLTALPWPTYVIPESQKIGSLLESAIGDSVWNNRKAVRQAVEEIRGPIEALLAAYLR